MSWREDFLGVGRDHGEESWGAEGEAPAVVWLADGAGSSRKRELEVVGGAVDGSSPKMDLVWVRELEMAGSGSSSPKRDIIAVMRPDEGGFDVYAKALEGRYANEVLVLR